MFSRTANAARQAARLSSPRPGTFSPSSLPRLARGYASSEPSLVESAKKKAGSDLPWIIGSALVFIPLFITLTSPPAIAKQHHVTSPNKPEHAERIPATLKATESEPAEDKEPSPADAEEASEKEEEKEPEQAEKAAPSQEGKPEKDEGKKEEEKEEAKPVGDNVATQEQRMEATPEAKEGAKQKQPKQQEKVENAIEESKQEEAKKDEE
ncbi:hypothetical protein JCM11251_006852 [Rhodosporidiobolus azoricus]